MSGCPGRGICGFQRSCARNLIALSPPRYRMRTRRKHRVLAPARSVQRSTPESVDISSKVDWAGGRSGNSATANTSPPIALIWRSNVSSVMLLRLSSQHSVPRPTLKASANATCVRLRPFLRPRSDNPSALAPRPRDPTQADQFSVAVCCRCLTENSVAVR